MAGNPRVMVVDQDFDTRAELQKGLVRAQFVVVGGVGYGAEALSLAAELKPNVVLVGVGDLPARALQTIESLTELLPDSPVLAYSAQKDAESASRTVVAGARDYLTKPLKMEKVVKAVRTALSSQERRQALISGDPVSGLKSGGMVITVFGAKGGIGKTTMSTNLATAFVALNAGSAVIVDVDTVFGDAAIMLDLTAESSLVEAAEKIDQLDQNTLHDYLVVHESGVKVLPAPFDPVDWRNVSPEAVAKVITLLAQTYDFVVVDCPATFTDVVAVALETATVILLLTSLDITSIKDTTTALKLLSSGIIHDDRIKLIINRPTNVNSVHEEDVSKVLQREIFWSVPHDKEVSASSQLGTPVVIDRPMSKISQTIRELAAMLAGVEVGQKRNGSSNGGAPSGLLTKLFRR